LIETETTMINAAVSQFVERPDEVIGIMQRVSHNVLHEIRRTYPLQGRIAHLTLTLSQGERGQRCRWPNTSTVTPRSSRSLAWENRRVRLTTRSIWKVRSLMP